MSNNDNEHYLDEEYHFAEEPDMGLESPAQEKTAESTASSASSSSSTSNYQPTYGMDKLKTFFNENSPARNVIVLMGILVMLFIIYKMVSGLFFNHTDVVSQKTPVKMQPARMTQKPITTQAPIVSQPTVDQSVLNDVNSLKSRLSTIEQNQSNLQDQMTSINTQLSSINTNLNALTDKLTQMNQQLMQLNVVVQEHGQEIVLLKAHLKSKPRVVKRIYPRGPSVVYYLKAVIPGRAWLIANNGNTLTVRVGSPIPGYGVVRFIDSIQGRVLTSSGQLIRFSQDDS